MRDSDFRRGEVGHRLVKDARLAELWRASTDAAHAVPTPPGGLALVCFKCMGDMITPASQDASVPFVVTAWASGPTRVCVSFSKAMDPGTAGSAGNYAVDGGATVNSVSLSASGTVATLTVSGMIGGGRTLTVSGMTDLSGNELFPDPTSLEFAFTSDVLDQPCPDPESPLDETGYYPGAFCYRDARAISYLNPYVDFGGDKDNVECLGVPLNPDEELHPGRYYVGFVCGERNGKAVVVVVAVEGADLGTATSTSTSTSTADLPPDSDVTCACGEGCSWLSSLHSGTDCLELTVEGAVGSFAGLDTTQTINWTYGSCSTATFDWTGGTGVVCLTFTNGIPVLTIGGHELTFLCCTDGVARFAGGPANGFTGSTQVTPANCPPDYFCVKIQCSCCQLAGWGGEGWYCVNQSGTGTSSTDCFVVELLDEDRCDSNIFICSGPYATEQQADDVCGPPSTGYVYSECLFGGNVCCPDFRIQTTLCVRFSAGSGFGATFDGLSFDVPYSAALTSASPCSLIFSYCYDAPPYSYIIQVTVSCNGASVSLGYGVGVGRYLSSGCVPGNVLVGQSGFASTSNGGGCALPPGSRPWNWTQTLTWSAGIGGGTSTVTVTEGNC